MLASGGHKWRTQKEALDEGVDLVVATPGRLAEHIKAGTLKLAQCQAVVLDEADVLLGDAFAFAQQVRPFLEVWCHLYCAQHLHARSMQAIAARRVANKDMNGLLSWQHACAPAEDETAQVAHPRHAHTHSALQQGLGTLAAGWPPACAGGPEHTACDVAVTGESFTLHPREECCRAGGAPEGGLPADSALCHGDRHAGGQRVCAAHAGVPRHHACFWSRQALQGSILR